MWRRGDTRHLLLLGLWVTADLRPLVASARTAVQSFATGECAASAAQAIIGLACWTAAATRLELSYIFSGSVRQCSREGSEVVERLPLDRSTEDGSRSCLLVPYTTLESSAGKDQKRAIRSR